MDLKLWQVDAFADRPFAGNPAAVVPLSAWLEDGVLQAIANENNLAETAFFVARDRGVYDLRWFTPTREVPLCGHATLASAWVIFEALAPGLDEVRFLTRSGELRVRKGPDGCHRMDFPAGGMDPFDAPNGFSDAIAEALGVGPPVQVFLAPTGAGGTAAPAGLWKEEGEVLAMRPSAGLESVLARAGFSALIATAEGRQPHDFVSRFFAPGMGVAEDPVTGSMHCALTPFWAKRLNKKTLRARQASVRGGEILCTDECERVILSGACALYLTGDIKIAGPDRKIAVAKKG